ncbi:c-type cytochrome [Sphingomonas morindae]|uniref:C-type cytochrome n=1 Tax=Sphingomonas morindae TaxID=1541170 RepID=A0ABY4X641_9SPHN|nr:c-type cytochrome [Sphingomonas morindae]USI72341.1 c-type cytochrome [Sphingomonas morindae]
MQEHQDEAQARVRAEAMTGGSAAAGAIAFGRYGCGACHRVRAIAGADGTVGPPLDHFARRTLIAGRFANDPAKLAAWLETPQRLVPGSGMPDLGVTPRDARDMAAYLYTLRP